MADRKLVEQLVKDLQMDYGPNFKRSTQLVPGETQTMAQRFLQYLLDTLETCSNTVAQEATMQMRVNKTSEFLDTARIHSAIRLARQTLHEDEPIGPDREGNVKCRACEDRGLGVVYIVKDGLLYSGTEPCRAEGCEAGAKRVPVFGRFQNCAFYEVVARFDRTQLEQETAFRRDWWARYHAQNSEALQAREPQGLD